MSEFREEDLQHAKDMIRAAFWGWARVKLEDKVDEIFDILSNERFRPNDNIDFTMTLTTLGNDFLVAVGCAINEREKRENDERFGNNDSPTDV